MSGVFPSLEKKQLLLTLLKVLGGHKAVVRFSGSGDSGSIDEICLMDRNGHNINLEKSTLPWPQSSSEFNQTTQKWERHTKEVDMEVADILQDITEQALEAQGLDWYNNEGGQGQFEIDLSTDPPNITLEVGINRTETDTYSYDYSEDEEDEGEPTEYADLEAEDKARAELFEKAGLK